MRIYVSRIAVMVLGLLMEGERHGYDLVKAMGERGMLRWTRASKVAVYKTLARLEAQGYLVSWTEKEGGAPEKRVYAVTGEGEERLRDLVYALCSSQEPLNFDTCVGLSFIQYMDRDEILDALQKRLQYLEGCLNRLKDEKDILDGLGNDIFLEILRHEQASYKEEASWLSRMLTKIEGGEGGGAYGRGKAPIKRK